jgi:3-polyprenyl-4-hydroxybenzoate decarboxylase
MRAFKNLRDFLQLLEVEKQLLRVSDEVRLDPDLAAAARAITRSTVRRAGRCTSTASKATRTPTW